MQRLEVDRYLSVEDKYIHEGNLQHVYYTCIDWRLENDPPPSLVNATVVVDWATDLHTINPLRELITVVPTNSTVNNYLAFSLVRPFLS